MLHRADDSERTVSIHDPYCCFQCDCVPICNTFHDGRACCTTCRCILKPMPSHCHSVACKRCPDDLHDVDLCAPCKCACTKCTAIRFNEKGHSVDVSKHLVKHHCTHLHCCMKMDCCISGPVGQLECLHRDSLHECCIRLLRLPAQQRPAASISRDQFEQRHG